MSASHPPTLEPEVETHSEVDPSAGRPGHFPKLPIREWLIYSVLAAALALTNIYTTLLTGWGDGGSLIAVVAAVALLSVFRRRAHIQSLNLGQTLASAGGTVGFAATSYAAIRIAFPKKDLCVEHATGLFGSYECLASPTVSIDGAMLLLLFVGLGMIGVVLGTAVRKQMVGYYFPSGTACAVVQKTVTTRTEDARRPVQLLTRFAAIAGVWAVLATVAIKKGGSALLTRIPLGKMGTTELGISLNPVFFGIGIVVGPRVGLGMILGAMSAPLIIEPALAAQGDISHLGDWVKWSAIALLTLPTFATLLFALMFRVPPVVPAGFKPGRSSFTVPPNRTLVYGLLCLVGVGITAFTAQALFDLSWVLTIAVVGACLPLAIMNGRVTGETDINPVRLVIIVILTLFALAMSSTVTMLLGMVMIATMLAGMAVDMMQDYRTGYLIDANPTHQTSVQFIGVLIGCLVAIPFVLYLENAMGFGPGSPLPAPGPVIYATMAKAFTGGAYMSTGLIWGIVAISVGGCAYAFFTVWPKSARFMPSLFGAGIGMLLPVEACAAIFAGGLIKWGATSWYKREAKEPEAVEKALNAANNDTLLAGSAIFAAAAITSVIIILIIEICGWPYMAH